MEYEKILTKILTASEKERHYVVVPAKYRHLFPASEHTFKVKIKGKIFETYIDKYNRLRLGSRIFNELDLDSPNTAVCIIKCDPSLYIIKRTKLRKSR